MGQCDWKQYAHPKTGELLGNISVEKIKTQLAPWYYRTRPESLQPEIAEYHNYIGKAIQGHGLKPADILNAYINHCAKDEFPHSAVLRTEATVKLCNGLEENGILKGNFLDGYEPTMTELLSIIRDFRNLWALLVEGKSSDE